jgi:hypothetical protein
MVIEPIGDVRNSVNERDRAVEIASIEGSDQGGTIVTPARMRGQFGFHGLGFQYV